ncbi:MAG: RidA family protein [Myxococcales bacterium]|nr:RidA family protein [Myxococcales bacterium]MCB9544631.1 RidA family protein [Myxococcales bacterium]
MSRAAIATAAAPAAIGPYSQAIRAGDTLWLSGQIALDPATGAVRGATAAEQAEQVMANLGAVLEAAGAGFGQLVRCTIFLKDLADFAAVNAVYARFMPDPPPARACVEVSRLPRDVLVEIDGIAWLEQ